MSAADMVSVDYVLNIQPGRIPPTVRIKEGSTSVLLTFHLKATNEEYPDDEVSMSTTGTAVIKATRPDGTEVVIAKGITSIESDFIVVQLVASEVEELSAVPGVFKCTISVIDVAYSTYDAYSGNYEAFDLITVQPFYMRVFGTAYGSENLDGTVMETAEAYLEV